MNAGPESPATGRWKLTAIFGIPFALMALAWGMYFTGLGVPEDTHNAGALIQPPVRMPELDIDGWTWVIGDDGRCAADCERWLYMSRQAHVAMGKDAFRASRLYYHHGEISPRVAAHLREQHPNIGVQRAPEALAGHAGLPAAPIYLADPGRFLVMAYCADGADAPLCDAAGMLDDVKFLLRHARGGRDAPSDGAGGS